MLSVDFSGFKYFWREPPRPIIGCYAVISCNGGGENPSVPPHLLGAPTQQPQVALTRRGRVDQGHRSRLARPLLAYRTVILAGARGVGRTQASPVFRRLHEILPADLGVIGAGDRETRRKAGKETFSEMLIVVTPLT